MKIDKVTYNTSFVTGPYLQDKIGFEATLEKGDTPKKALSELKKIAEEWQKENIAPAEQVKIPEIQVGPYVSDANAEAEILKSKDLAELKKFALFVNSNPQFKNAYDQRWKELSNGKPSKRVVLP